jgi:hypothetical protein
VVAAWVGLGRGGGAGVGERKLGLAVETKGQEWLHESQTLEVDRKKLPEVI